MKVIAGVYSGVTTVELDTLAAETAASMTTKHPDYAILAARIAVSNLHKETMKSFSGMCVLSVYTFHFTIHLLSMHIIATRLSTCSTYPHSTFRCDGGTLQLCSSNHQTTLSDDIQGDLGHYQGEYRRKSVGVVSGKCGCGLQKDCSSICRGSTQPSSMTEISATSTLVSKPWKDHTCSKSMGKVVTIMCVNHHVIVC